MTDRYIDGFFYGLFMDADLLAGNHIFPLSPRRGYVDGYVLRIGKRATLVQTQGARVYGMVFSLIQDDFEKLYSMPGLERYRPEAVLAHGLDGQSYPALCYNLFELPAQGERNKDYAVQLQVVLRKLEFPEDYIATLN